MPQKQVHCLCKCVVSMAQIIAAGPGHEARLAAENVQCGQGRVSATRPRWDTHANHEETPRARHPGQAPVTKRSSDAAGGGLCLEGNAARGGRRAAYVPRGPIASRRRREEVDMEPGAN